MAKAPAAQPAAEAPASAPAPKRGKKLLVIIILAVVALVVVIAAVVAVLLLRKGHATEEEHAEKPAAVATVDLSHPPTFVALDPFVVNLAPAEGDRYLQVVMALRVSDHKIAESLKGFMPDIRHEINLLLSSKLPSELSTPEGREDLATQIVNRTNQVLTGVPPPKGESAKQAVAGPIEAVRFNSFIIQ
jgi:flagellar protein FliL